MTLLPGPIPSARNARCRAAVPLDTARAWSTPNMALIAASKAWTSGPIDSYWFRRTRSTAPSSSGPKSISLSGIGRDDKVESLLILSQQLLRAVVVGRTSDVEPEAIGPECRDLLAIREKAQHQIREVEVFTTLDVTQDRRLVHVHTHADVIRMLRLLDIVRDGGRLVELDHAEIDLDVTTLGRDGQDGSVLPMEVDELVEIQIR